MREKVNIMCFRTSRQYLHVPKRENNFLNKTKDTNKTINSLDHIKIKNISLSIQKIIEGMKN